MNSAVMRIERNNLGQSVLFIVIEKWENMGMYGLQLLRIACFKTVIT